MKITLEICKGKIIFRQKNGKLYCKITHKLEKVDYEEASKDFSSHTTNKCWFLKDNEKNKRLE